VKPYQKGILIKKQRINMKKIVLINILLSLAALFACTQEMQEESTVCENCVIWGARPMASIDDSRVQIYWENPMPYMLASVPTYNPDEFDIFISESNMSNFQKVIELKTDEYSYTIDKLQNGKPYFFYVVSKKEGFESLTSVTIMVIPNKRKEFEILQTIEKTHTIEDVSLAHKLDKIAYVDGFYAGVIISNMDGSEKELVNTNSHGPSWSPENDKIVFHTKDWTKPATQIVLYDYNTKTTTPLTDGTRNSYNPVFSENGESILFEAAKDTVTSNGLVQISSEVEAYDIRLIDMKTLESFQITDISSVSAMLARKPCWIDNDRFLFSAFEQDNYELFESSISGRQINKVFDSKWDEFSPSISPDKKKIAFISNRSGTNAVWIYNIDDKTYTQISGYSDTKSMGAHEKIQWLNNSSIIFTVNSSQLVKQKIE
jgi:hypothetical protein